MKVPGLTINNQPLMSQIGSSHMLALPDINSMNNSMATLRSEAHSGEKEGKHAFDMMNSFQSGEDSSRSLSDNEKAGNQIKIPKKSSFSTKM